jgi:hypothetical protein
MGSVRSTAFLLLLAGPGLAVGPPPVITGVSANPLLSQSTNTLYSLEILGQNFWISGPNDPSRRAAYVRRLPQPFQAIKIYTISNNTLGIWLSTAQFLNAPGRLEIMARIDGVNSNVFSVNILAEPPRLDSITPEKINAGGNADDPRWKVVLRGSRWIDPTTVWINGANVGRCFQNFNLQREVFTWPLSLREGGKYSVQLKTEHGGSAIRTVEIVVPPTVKRAAIAKEPAGTGAMSIARPPTPTPGVLRLKP